MKNGQLHSFRDQMKQSQTFLSLAPIVQKILLTRNNVSIIKHGLTVAQNIGYDKWEQQSGFSTRNKLIIKDLLNENTDI